MQKYSLKMVCAPNITLRRFNEKIVSTLGEEHKHPWVTLNWGVAAMVEGTTSTQKGGSQLEKRDLTAFEEELSRVLLVG